MPKNTNSLTQYNEWIKKSIEWAKGHKNWKKTLSCHESDLILQCFWIVYTIGTRFLCVCRNCISLMDPCGRWSVSPQHFPSDNNNTRARMKKTIHTRAPFYIWLELFLIWEHARYNIPPSHSEFLFEFVVHRLSHSTVQFNRFSNVNTYRQLQQQKYGPKYNRSGWWAPKIQFRFISRCRYFDIQHSIDYVCTCWCWKLF